MYVYANPLGSSPLFTYYRRHAFGQLCILSNGVLCTFSAVQNKLSSYRENKQYFLIKSAI